MRIGHPHAGWEDGARTRVYLLFGGNSARHAKAHACRDFKIWPGMQVASSCSTFTQPTAERVAPGGEGGERETTLYMAIDCRVYIPQLRRASAARSWTGVQQLAFTLMAVNAHDVHMTELQQNCFQALARLYALVRLPPFASLSESVIHAGVASRCVGASLCCAGLSLWEWDQQMQHSCSDDALELWDHVWGGPHSVWMLAHASFF